MGTVAKNIGNTYDVTTEVLESLRSGEEWAFNEVYARYASPIKDFISSLIHNDDDAMEMCHDIFEELWIERHRIIPAKGIQRLLFIKARNRAMDYFDHQKVMRRYAEFCNRHTDHGLPADTHIEGEDTRYIIEIYLRGLPNQRESIFRLRHESNFTIDEIAARLGLSVSTVKNNLSMVNSGLKKIL